MVESTNIAGYQSLGECIVINTLSTAYLSVAKTPLYTNTKIQREAMECIMFIFNGGVDVIIRDFGLVYDADTLRNQFYNFLKTSYKEIQNGGEVPSGYSNQKLDKIMAFIETSEILDR